MTWNFAEVLTRAIGVLESDAGILSIAIEAAPDADNAGLIVERDYYLADATALRTLRDKVQKDKDVQARIAAVPEGTIDLMGTLAGSLAERAILTYCRTGQ